jgi:hypothetical protein
MKPVEIDGFDCRAVFEGSVAPVARRVLRLYVTI